MPPKFERKQERNGIEKCTCLDLDDCKNRSRPSWCEGSKTGSIHTYLHHFIYKEGGASENETKIINQALTTTPRFNSLKAEVHVGNISI